MFLYVNYNVKSQLQSILLLIMHTETSHYFISASNDILQPLSSHPAGWRKRVYVSVSSLERIRERSGAGTVKPGKD